MHLQLTISLPHREASDILVAELSRLGFEGFVEEENKLQAFIPEEDFDKVETEKILGNYKTYFNMEWNYHAVKNENWNAVWESNFEPVSIAGRLNIRALFHEKNDAFPMEIVIQPKMSFGTGHHATTSSVCELMLSMDFKDKEVMDFGTGTGILAILAHKLGAKEIWAVDNDPVCVENSEENIRLNDAMGIHILEGDINTIERGNFDIIIGNITRNVILQYFPVIETKLEKNGFFLASGFYESDLEMLKSEAHLLGLQLESQKVKDGWCAASFRKL